LAEPPVRKVRTRAAWAKWLEAHHGDDAGVWLKFAKKGSGVTTVTYAEALEVALCYGWIDAMVKRLDETYYLQRFTPRRARSKWSKLNREAAARLIEAGLMRPSGRAEVERAEASFATPLPCVGDREQSVVRSLRKCPSQRGPDRLARTVRTAHGRQRRRMGRLRRPILMRRRQAAPNARPRREAELSEREQ
jgi:hypothetical protein